MTQTLISELAELILGDRPTEDADAAGAAKELSVAFTSGRSELHGDYFSDKRMLDAYVAAFLIPNAAKTMHCLMQMDDLGLIPKKDAISVLDLGTGPGTSVLAASLFFARRYPDKFLGFAGVEQNRSALSRAHGFFRRVAPPNHSFESATKEVEPGTLDTILKDHRFDLVIFGNLLNELAEGDGYKLCREVLMGHLTEDGALMIIDPALRDTARPLMALRDRLVGEKLASVAAPCLHQSECPMLSANDRDWCHFYIDWKRPDHLVWLDRISGMDHRHLKMAYLILKRSHGEDQDNRGRWRVVSSPIVSKGKRELVLCGENGKLRKITRLDRDSSEKNRVLDEAGRGDIITLNVSGRISKEDHFSIYAPWR